MKLYILRHGEAGKRPPVGSKSSEASLTITGQNEITEVSKAIMELGLKFDLIATSPLKAAYQTAEILSYGGSKLKSKDKRKIERIMYRIEKWDELKPEGKKQLLWRKLSKLDSESSILIVGHEPGLGEIISEVIVPNDHPINNVHLKKGSLAKVEIFTFRPKTKGKLDWLISPKILKKMVK